MVKCEICGKEFKIISHKHLKKHETTIKEYRRQFPNTKFSPRAGLKGIKAWNKGLTKETDSRVASMYPNSRNEKIVKSSIKSWENSAVRDARIEGQKKNYREKDQTLRNQHISEGEKKSFRDNPGRRKIYSRLMKNTIHKLLENGFKLENNAYTVAKYDEELGHYVRSGWEKEFVLGLLANKIEYQYEPKRFDLGDCFFSPDFYLPKYNCYVEINGITRPRKKYKLDKFKELYPEIELLLLGKQNKKDSLIQQFLAQKGR